MTRNEYTPFVSQILNVQKHTDIEYTFRMSYEGNVRPGQFFELSLPKYGEAPISVSGIGEGFVELTIRRVGRVTEEVFEHYAGDRLFMRGPYGNGFDINNYKGKELLVVAGGTGLSPVRGLVDYFASHSEEVQRLSLVSGFKSPQDILFREDLKRFSEQAEVVVTVDRADAEYQGHVGLVTEYLSTIKFVDITTAAAVVVGPPAMMRFTCQELLKLGFGEANIWISQERKMCCGIGKCGHCKINDVYVCVDGPVFNYTKGKHLVD